MFRAVLFTQWKWVRWPLLVGTILAFGTPVMSVQGIGLAELFGGPGHGTAAVLASMELWSTGYPILAAGLALLVAATGWAPDERGKHVYAMSLPVPRWHYVLLRIAAGGVLLLAPVIALTAGALTATAATTLPLGIHAYPIALSLRFMLAVAVAYALMFLAAASGQRVGYFVSGAFGVVVAAQIVLALFGSFNLIYWIGGLLLQWPGPLEIFTGRWMLIDV